jgi:hypothetical protein
VYFEFFHARIDCQYVSVSKKMVSEMSCAQNKKTRSCAEGKLPGGR